MIVYQFFPESGLLVVTPSSSGL